MNRARDNKKGADTYNDWYPSRNNYCGTVGNSLGTNFIVESLPRIDIPPEPEETLSSDATEQVESFTTEQGQTTINNFFDVKIKHNIHGNVIQNLTLS